MRAPLPRITLITPSFNQGRYIEETICSVLDQGYPNLEYMVIDGGSTDDTLAVVERYARHLAWHESAPDRGQAHAISKGVARATGEVINWLNSDDYLAPGALRAVGEAFQDPATRVFCGISRTFGMGPDRYTSGTDVYPDNLEKTIAYARIDQPETFFRKEGWDAIGGIDATYHYLMDRDLWIRHLLHFGLDGIVKTQVPLANFRLHPTSKTVSQADRFARESAELFTTLAFALGQERVGTLLQRTLGAEPRARLPRNHRADPVRTMHYHLLALVEEAYFLGRYDRIDALAGAIDQGVLTTDDRRVLRSVLARRRYLPRWVRQGWHAVRAVVRRAR